MAPSMWRASYRRQGDVRVYEVGWGVTAVALLVVLLLVCAPIAVAVVLR